MDNDIHNEESMDREDLHLHVHVSDSLRLLCSDLEILEGTMEGVMFDKSILDDVLGMDCMVNQVLQSQIR